MSKRARDDLCTCVCVKKTPPGSDSVSFIIMYANSLCPGDTSVNTYQIPVPNLPVELSITKLMKMHRRNLIIQTDGKTNSNIFNRLQETCLIEKFRVEYDDDSLGPDVGPIVNPIVINIYHDYGD